MDPKSGSAASYLTCNIEYAEYWRNQYQEVVQQLDRLKVCFDGSFRQSVLVS